MANAFLTTDRVYLRRFALKDVDDVFAYASVEGVGEMAGWPHHQSKEDSLDFVKKIAMRGPGSTYAIVSKFNKRVIGSFSISPLKRDEAYFQGRQVGEIGYVLSQDYWGIGIMPEIVKAFCKKAFTSLGYDVLILRYFLWNSRSRRVAEKCGFTKRFENKDAYVKQLDKYLDEGVMVLTKEEYLLLEQSYL